jgi:hypothetical protein
MAPKGWKKEQEISKGEVEEKKTPPQGSEAFDSSGEGTTRLRQWIVRKRQADCGISFLTLWITLYSQTVEAPVDARSEPPRKSDNRV